MNEPISKCCNELAEPDAMEYPCNERWRCSKCGSICSIKSPTNEPKMPEVIYATVEGHWFEDKNGGLAFKGTTYHHDNKVQELRQALRECVNTGLDYLQHPSSDGSPLRPAKLIAHMKAITKASNLLK